MDGMKVEQLLVTNYTESRLSVRIKFNGNEFDFNTVRLIDGWMVACGGPCDVLSNWYKYNEESQCIVEIKRRADTTIKYIHIPENHTLIVAIFYQPKVKPWSN